MAFVDVDKWHSQSDMEIVGKKGTAYILVFTVNFLVQAESVVHWTHSKNLSSTQFAVWSNFHNFKHL